MACEEGKVSHQMTTDVESGEGSHGTQRKMAVELYDVIGRGKSGVVYTAVRREKLVCFILFFQRSHFGYFSHIVESGRCEGHRHVSETRDASTLRSHSS